MGTHPIFESDFDCLTDFRERGEEKQTLENTSRMDGFKGDSKEARKRLAKAIKAVMTRNRHYVANQVFPTSKIASSDDDSGKDNILSSQESCLSSTCSQDSSSQELSTGDDECFTRVLPLGMRDDCDSHCSNFTKRKNRKKLSLKLSTDSGYCPD